MNNNIKFPKVIFITDFDYSDIINECADGLPIFDDGRIDFSTAKIIPVVNIILAYEDEILIMKRTSKVLTNKNMWDCIGGYYDEIIPPEKKALKEVIEETGISHSNILSTNVGKIFNIIDKNPARRWIVFPIMFTLKDKIDPKLDWEHSDFKWIKKNRIQGFAQSKKVRNVLYHCTIVGN